MAVLVKEINGLPYASIKTRNGLAVASIKSINGLDASPPAVVLTFFWGMEGATWSNAEVAGGSATGTPNAIGGGTATTDETTTVKVGSHAMKATTSQSACSFAGASNIGGEQGSMGLWLRFASIKTFGAGVFRAQADANNRVQCNTLSNGRLAFTYLAAGASASFNINAGATMAVNTWYFVIMRWKRSANLFSLGAYNADGTNVFLQTKSDSSLASAFAGTPTIMVGDYAGTGVNGDMYFDSVMVSADDQADLLGVRNNTFP